MRNRAGFREVDRVPGGGQSGRDDVSEPDQLRDRAVQHDAKHAVVMSVRHEESAAIRFQGVLDSRRDNEREPGRRVLARKRADVCDDGRARRPVHAVYPDGLRVTGEQVVGKHGSDDAHEGVRGRADERDVHDAAERELTEPPWQTARIQGLVSALRIDAPYLARRGLGDVQRAAGTNGAPGAGPTRQCCEQFRISRLSCRRCGAGSEWHDHRHQGNTGNQQSSSSTHASLPSLRPRSRPGPVAERWCRRPSRSRRRGARLRPSGASPPQG